MSDDNHENDPARPRAAPLETGGRAAKPRGPRAFVLEGDGARRGRVRIADEPDFVAAGEAPAETAPLPRPGNRLAGLFWSAAIGLLILFAVDAAFSLVVSLETKAPWAGRLAMALLAIVFLGLAGYLAREIISILRMARVTRFRERAAMLPERPDLAEARAFARDLAMFYAADASAAAARAEIARLIDEPQDGLTVLAATERVLLGPKDDAARRAIADAAQNVSVITAISPRAILDVAFVLAQSVALIRRLSAIYGGRASGFGLLRLTTRVIGHLAITGSVAVADTFLSQLVGAGLAARISAKLGEGVLNGVLTARIGIAAIDLCRPVPFRENRPIILSEVVKISVLPEKVAEKPAV